VRSSDGGSGAVSLGTALPGTDALVTDTPGLILSLFFADCLPILLADVERYAVGLSHAGWRGLAAGVVENIVAAMRESFGTDPSTLIAAIGPGIGPCCFEVGDDVASHFPRAAPLSPVTGRRHVDLTAAAFERLILAGVLADQITFAGECTACGDPTRWFSHRRDRGRTGRMGALIGIRIR
jgi:polyphenol oxidase